MNDFKEVKKDIYWVGTLDYDIRIFDIVMHTEFGTTYNSFVVKGTEKTVLFEISKEGFFDEYIERVSKVCDPTTIDYVVVNHTEPDHSGSLTRLLEICPNITVIGTATALKFLTEITNMQFKSIVAKNGDTIDIGGKTLEFIVAPFLHWPDTMFTFIKEDKTIFTCDFLGCHYCTDVIFNDLITEDFSDAYKYYFDCIMSPFKPFVLGAIDKIKDLDIEIVCTGHGPVLRKDVKKYIDLYKTWSTPIKKEKALVVIPYVSSYGYTKKLALEIEKGLLSIGNINVSTFDLVYTKMEDVLKEISNADGILIGSPTLLGDTLPPILALLSELNPIIHKGMMAGVFGSYGWSGEAIPNIEDRIKQLKFKMPLPSLKVIFNPSKTQLSDAFEFGVDFGMIIVDAFK